MHAKQGFLKGKMYVWKQVQAAATRGGSAASGWLGDHAPIKLQPQFLMLKTLCSKRSAIVACRA